MKKQLKLAALTVATIVGVNGLVGSSALAAVNTPVSAVAQADYGQYSTAINELVKQNVLAGYGDGTMKPDQTVNRAELAKLVVLALQVQSNKEGDPALTDVNAQNWYYNYVNTIVEAGIMADKEGVFNPLTPVTHAELTQTIAKALQRDNMSVQSWMNGYSADKVATRGETFQLLVTAQKSIRSEEAKITSIRSVNKVTMEVTLDRPMTSQDESIETSAKNFVFDNDLKLVNQPRLKTGSYATYILPTSTQKAGVTYTLNYKGAQTLTVAASDEMIDTNEARQVDNDSFEIESLRTDGVIDYGYVISAYSGGRGKNATILDENNKINDQQFQLIPSLRSRSVTITPEGGEAMTAAYLPFTQSTDGRQEAKFRLPNGAKFKPGVKYTVTSDWLTIKNPTFVAEEFKPAGLDSVAQVDETKLAVTLTQDPGDEIFVQREVKLVGSDKSELKAQYTFSTRKGATGTFALQNDAKLTSGVTYTVSPIGDWAKSSEALTFTAK